MNNPAYTLDDGEDRAAANPVTFVIPPRMIRERIPMGFNVKLMFKSPDGRVERMWVQVTEQGPDGSYTGFINNDPVIIAAKWKDIIAFGPEHIINILSPDGNAPTHH